MKTLTIIELLSKVDCKRGKVYDFYKNNPELKEETNIKNRKRLYPESHVKYFSSEKMFEENKILSIDNKCMMNVIDRLYHKDTIASTMWFRPWSFFFTIAYKHERSKNYCRTQLDGCFYHLEKKYGERTKINMLYSTEKFPNRNGYHNHFVLYIEDKSLRKKVLDEIKDYFKYDRVDYSVYNRHKGAVYYTAKHGLEGEDWDFH